MKAKKLLILLLAALIALVSLCACGGGETESDSAPDSAGSVYDSYARSSDETQENAEGEDGAESSGSSLNDNYFQSSVML